MISDPQTPIEKQNAIPDASKRRNRLLWGLISGIIVVIIPLGGPGDYRTSQCAGQAHVVRYGQSLSHPGAALRLRVVWR
jgi:hypothetical protein